MINLDNYLNYLIKSIYCYYPKYSQRINSFNINPANNNKLINLDNDFNYLIKSIYFH